MGAKSWLAGACLAASAALANAGEEWRTLESPHYTVISQLDDRATRAWAVEFDEFIASLTAALGLRAAALPPLTVVLFDDASHASPDCCAHAEGERVIGLVAGGH